MLLKITSKAKCLSKSNFCVWVISMADREKKVNIIKFNNIISGIGIIQVQWIIAWINTGCARREWIMSMRGWCSHEHYPLSSLALARILRIYKHIRAMSIATNRQQHNTTQHSTAQRRSSVTVYVFNFVCLIFVAEICSCWYEQFSCEK